jgi:hypothetical protein
MMKADAVELEPAMPLRDALRLAFLFALLKFAIHVATNVWQAHLGWGYFADEPYYILCGQHLDWGYVDHGPIVALQARLAVLLFGKSLAGIRMFAAAAGAAKVFLTGLLAWQFGARRAGQSLAMIGVLLAPDFLALDSFLSMNSFEPIFWMTAAFAVLRLVDGASPKWWVVAGVAAGIGIENKPTMIVYSRWMWIGVAIAVLLVLPFALWQFHHQWATLRFIHRGKVVHKNPVVDPLALLYIQAYLMSPVSLPLWGAGLVWLLIGKTAARFRCIGWAYLFFEVLMMATRDAVAYYMSPIYPMLFAAGGCIWELRTRSAWPRWILPAYACLLAATGILFSPLSIPILSAQRTVVYTARTHLIHNATQMDPSTQSPLHEFFADRFGWQELADDVTRIYRSLPVADRAHAGILCTNYEEASAINFLGAGRGLPFAISPHNNYFLWGPHGESGEVMIVISTNTTEQLLRFYDSVEVVGAMNHPYAMPGAHRTIYLCRGRKRSMLLYWQYLRTYL